MIQRKNLTHNADATNVLVTIAQAAKLLLSGRVPALKDDRPKVGVEAQRVDLYANRGHILLLELARQVTLHEGRLPDAAVAHKDELKLRRCVPSSCSGSLTFQQRQDRTPTANARLRAGVK